MYFQSLGRVARVFPLVNALLWLMPLYLAADLIVIVFELCGLNTDRAWRLAWMAIFCIVAACLLLLKGGSTTYVSAHACTVSTLFADLFYNILLCLIHALHAARNAVNLAVHSLDACMSHLHAWDYVIYFYPLQLLGLEVPAKSQEAAHCSGSKHKKCVWSYPLPGIFDTFSSFNNNPVCIPRPIGQR